MEYKPLTFTLTALQRQKTHQWLKDPAKSHRCGPDSFGTIVSFRFTPSGIGDSVAAICPCGQTLDLTDLDEGPAHATSSILDW